MGNLLLVSSVREAQREHDEDAPVVAIKATPLNSRRTDALRAYHRAVLPNVILRTLG
jgi:hypothetical protein